MNQFRSVERFATAFGFAIQCERSLAWRTAAKPTVANNRIMTAISATLLVIPAVTGLVIVVADLVPAASV